jgi:hypothetical protein
MAFHMCIYCTLIRLAPTITYSFSVTLLPYYSTALSAFNLLSSYTDAMYFSSIQDRSLFLSCLLLLPSNRPTITIMFSFLIYTHIYVHKIIYAFFFKSFSYLMDFSSIFISIYSLYWRFV